MPNRTSCIVSPQLRDRGVIPTRHRLLERLPPRVLTRGLRVLYSKKLLERELRRHCHGANSCHRSRTESSTASRGQLSKSYRACPSDAKFSASVVGTAATSSGFIIPRAWST